MERNYLLRKRKAQSEVCRDDKAPTGGASPLIRLAKCPRLPSRGSLILHRILTAIYFQFDLRSRLIAASFTAPRYSPSSQQPKSSKSNNFLSSKPIVVTTSSSMISDMKYCGKPREYTIFSPLFSIYFIMYANASPKRLLSSIFSKSDLQKFSLK